MITHINHYYLCDHCNVIAPSLSVMSRCSIDTTVQIELVFGRGILQLIQQSVIRKIQVSPK